MNMNGYFAVIIIALLLFIGVILMNRGGKGESEFTKTLQSPPDNIAEVAPVDAEAIEMH